MKSPLLFIQWILLACCICQPVSAQSTPTVSKRQKNIEKWITSHFGRNTLPPFSFQYDGIPSSSFIKGWKYSSRKHQTEDANVIRYTFTYLSPDNLKVEAEVNGYPAFNTVDWVLRFTNTGQQETKQISNVNVSDLNMALNKGKEVKLHYSKGSFDSKEDFMPMERPLLENEPFAMASKGGRSSDSAFPFFNIETSSDEGVIVGIGWSGNWFASMERKSQQLNLTSGLQHLNTFLYPQESIRTPSICLLFWKGDSYLIGHNKFRRFIRTHRTRIINGNPVQTYPLFNGFNWGDPAPCNEYTCMTTEYAVFLIHRWKQFNLTADAIWLDAGWYTHAADYKDNKNWANTVGNWKIDKTRFPDGFKTISNEAHKAGLQFMVWFEPERVYHDSDWATEHPDWMLKSSYSKTNYLFNLGNDEARKWLCQYIGDFMEENGIDIYRQDFNIAPERYWNENDEDGRTGICEVKYITGLYQYWDYLLNRFPHMLIDNCASGGRRLDYETTLRSAPMWRTDYGYGTGVEGYQSQTYGLNLYLPFSATGVYQTDNYHFRSSVSSSAVFNWKLTTNEVSFLDMQHCLAELQEVRPYFVEDYYPLSGVDNLASDKIWLAYELFRPSDETGYVFAFRRAENKDNSYIVCLQGLQDKKTYQLINKDTQEITEKQGSELKQGITLTLEKPESCLLLQIKPKE